MRQRLTSLTASGLNVCKRSSRNSSNSPALANEFSRSNRGKKSTVPGYISPRRLRSPLASALPRCRRGVAPGEQAVSIVGCGRRCFRFEQFVQLTGKLGNLARIFFDLDLLAQIVDSFLLFRAFHWPRPEVTAIFSQPTKGTAWREASLPRSLFMPIFSLVTRYNNSHPRTRFSSCRQRVCLCYGNRTLIIHRGPFPVTSLGSSSCIQDLLYSHCYEGDL
jgi:hypothetical protein